MRKLYIHLCCIFLLLFNFQSIELAAQSMKVSGKVVSSDGKPIERVTVTVKGLKEASLTNGDGLFTITADRKSVLQFSAIGFKSVEVTAGAEPMSVILESQTESLDQVVVVGYTRQKKST